MPRNVKTMDDALELLTPEARYSMHGTFEVISEDDFGKFPASFDKFGWPLFGDCNRYSLFHPITGRPWYEAPREPKNNEEDPKYSDWFQLALEYVDARAYFQVQESSKKLTRPKDIDQDSLRFAEGSDAFFANTAYLAKHVHPRLRELFARRECTPEFAQLWGQYKEVTGALVLSAKRAFHTEKSAEGGRNDDRAAQLKYYLHWRRYADTLGLKKRLARSEFVQYVYNIVADAIEPPPGFAKEWFERAATRIPGSDGKLKFVPDLPDTLKRSGTDKRRKPLLASNPTNDPRIPPVQDIHARIVAREGPHD